MIPRASKLCTPDVDVPHWQKIVRCGVSGWALCSVPRGAGGCQALRKAVGKTYAETKFVPAWDIEIVKLPYLTAEK